MSAFTNKLNGTLQGILRWEDWESLIGSLMHDQRNRWYLSAAGAASSATAITPEALSIFLQEINTLLRRDHDEDYLGIVYVDNPQSPSLIKIYDPNNLGSACGSVGFKINPGWVLSLDAPTSEIEAATPLPGGRRRWLESLYQKLLGA